MKARDQSALLVDGELGGSTRGRRIATQRRVEVSKARGGDAIMGRMIVNTTVLLVSLFAPGASGAAPQASDPGRYFAIEVVDEQSGRGDPMVELQTT